jgi:hypothetical protein
MLLVQDRHCHEGDHTQCAGPDLEHLGCVREVTPTLRGAAREAGQEKLNLESGLDSELEYH